MWTQQLNKMWIELINKKLVDFDFLLNLLPTLLWNIQPHKWETLSQQSPDNAFRGITQGLFVVAPFQHHYQFRLDFQQSLNHVGISFWFYFEASERVAFRRVESGRDVD